MRNVSRDIFIDACKESIGIDNFNNMLKDLDIFDFINRDNIVSLLNKLHIASESHFSDASREDGTDDIDDFRINHFAIRSFRKFTSDMFFGLNLTNYSSDSPHSVFLVGANGVGKSTIFNSLEYYYRKTISEAELRNTSFGNVSKNDIRVMSSKRIA